MLDRTRAWLAVVALWASCATGACAQMEPKAPPSVAPPAAVVRFIARRAVPVGPMDTAPSGPEAAAIDRLVPGARVIGFGETGHGALEPIAYRNRLIRYLVEHDGLTAVAIESGFAEGRRVADFVLGGPGDAAAIVRENLTHGFGDLAANAELATWLRAYNADHAHRPVHFYGIDLSTIQTLNHGRTGYGVVIADVLAYLERAAPDASVDIRARLAPFAGRFTEVDYPSYTPRERASVRAALADANLMFAERRRAIIAATSSADYAWAAREAFDARQLVDIFATWTVDPFHEQAKLIELLRLRDRAMAEHLLWALDQEGPGGRILLFQANGHVAAAPLVGSVMRLFPAQPDLTGTILRARLGPAYRVIASASAQGRTADDSSIGSIDRAFLMAGQTRSLLDLRDATPAAWWRQTQGFSQGGARVDDAVPARAFDALVFFDRLTPAPISPRR